MERNLRLLRVHEVLADALPWLPILVLFTSGRFGIDGALQLASIYYCGVVVAEVPSGWMSDRLGRVLTLKLAAAIWVVSHAMFLFSGSNFAMVAVAELLLAFGFAALSGTNVSLHYDTLEAIGKEDEYEERQSRLRFYGFVAIGVSSLVGGAIGWVNLRLVFALSMALAVAQLIVVFQFEEPPKLSAEQQGFASQLASCRNYLQLPLLRWVLGYWTAMVVLEHVAYTLSQPYLAEVLGRSTEDLGATPIAAGAQFALFSVFGAIAARQAFALRERLGFFRVLIGLAVLSASIVSAMAIWVSVAVALFMLLRSVQGAVAPTLLSAAVAPIVEQRHRATYFSVHSLAGRSVYGALLLTVSLTVGDDLTGALSLLAVAAWVLIVGLLAGLASSGVRASPGLAGGGA